MASCNSAAVGPFFRKFCSSSSASLSTFLKSPPGMAVSVKSNCPPISLVSLFGGGAGGDLIFVDQALVEARGFALPKNRFDEIELRFLG